jgi:hypothetical protein
MDGIRVPIERLPDNFTVAFRKYVFEGSHHPYDFQPRLMINFEVGDLLRIFRIHGT